MSRRLLKSPSLKRKSRGVPISEKVTLEKVLGITTQKNSGLTVDPNTGTIAYPAGCVIVLLNSKNKQSHIFSKKTITCLSFSSDGKYLVSGESGHQPCVRVWDVEEKTQFAEFAGHKFGINVVAFSPKDKYVISVGSHHDQSINVFNWKNRIKISSNKVSSKVSDLTFSEQGKYFITVGQRHVKFWYLDSSKSKIQNETVPLQGRNGLLGDHKNNYFCACATSKYDKTAYTISKSGLLCQFNEKRSIEKWVELKETSASSLAVDEGYLFVGCGDGIVRVFHCDTLNYVATVPRPHHLGVDISSALDTSQVHVSKDDKFPDTKATVIDNVNKKLICIYSDHSIYIWDIHNVRKVGKASSFLYHSSYIWGVDVYTTPDSGAPCLPPNTFITCSSDDTIRLWNLETHMKNTTNYKRNIYSNELLDITYCDPEYTYLTELDYNPAGQTDKTDLNYDQKNGVRNIQVSPDGRHMAAGDRSGNIRIYDLCDMNELNVIEAHDGEVLALEYVYPENGPRLLASASRDRMVHIFDVEQEYGLLQTLFDHSSSVTAIKFIDTEDDLKMLTCGADKSILFRKAEINPEFQFTLCQHLVGKNTLYDMDVDPSKKFVCTACQDRIIRIYNVDTAKQKKHYKGSLTDEGVLLKAQLDPSGSYIITSCTDKNLCILDFYTGEILATMAGHSEIATGVHFMKDFKHLISVSADGCIFVWKLPLEMTHTMQTAHSSLKKSQRQEEAGESNGNVISTDYRFSIGQLPKWAKNKFGSSSPESNAGDSAPHVRGKWAARATDTLDFATERRASAFDNPNNFQSQLNELRRDSIGLPGLNESVSIINDDDEANADDDDEDFIPLFHKNKKNGADESASSSSGSCRLSLYKDHQSGDEDGDLNSDTTEVLFYPHNEADSFNLGSGYKVYSTPRGKPKSRPSDLNLKSSKDGDSESTDPISLEDFEDNDETGVSSYPGTPSDFDMEFPASPQKDKFIRENLENMEFTPVSINKFQRTLDKVEEVQKDSSASITLRQSLSARFLKSKDPNMNLPRQDNWYDGLQKRKDSMNRSIAEAKLMFEEMGWKDRSPTDEEPTKLKSQTRGMQKNLEYSSDSGRGPTPPPSPNLSSTKTLRQSWSALPLSKEPIMEESTNKVLKKRHSSSPSLSNALTTDPRLDNNEKAFLHLPSPTKTAASKVTSKFEPSKTGGSIDTRKPSYMKPTKSANAKMLRSSSSSALIVNNKEEREKRLSGENIPKSNSIQNLSFTKTKKKPSALNRRSGSNLQNASKWATSTPNLAITEDTDEEEEETYISPLKMSADISRSEPDIFDVLSAISDQSQCSSESSSDTSKLSSEKSESRQSCSSATSSLSLKKQDDQANKKSPNDKMLMPPPSTTTTRAKHEAMFKKVSHGKSVFHAKPRRSANELTLDQAKDILLGRSGLLGESESEKKTSPPSSAGYVTSAAAFTSTFPRSHKSVRSSWAQQDRESKKAAARTTSPSSSNHSTSAIFTDPVTNSIVTEIEQTAAEALRHSSSLSNLPPSPHEYPVRDSQSAVMNRRSASPLCTTQTSTRDLSDRRHSASPSTMVSHTQVNNVQNYFSKEVTIVNSPISIPVEPTVTKISDSEELASSPSVRNRIAQFTSSTSNVPPSQPRRGSAPKIERPALPNVFKFNEREKTPTHEVISTSQSDASPDLASNCTKSISKLTDAVLEITDLYKKVSESDDKVSKRVENLLLEALKGTHESFGQLLSEKSEIKKLDTVDQSAQTSLQGTNGNCLLDSDRMFQVLKPILEQYSQRMPEQILYLFEKQLKS